MGLAAGRRSVNQTHAQRFEDARQVRLARTAVTLDRPQQLLEFRTQFRHHRHRLWSWIRYRCTDCDIDSFRFATPRHATRSYNVQCLQEPDSVKKSTRKQGMRSE
jgi:hypothetical protein